MTTTYSSTSYTAYPHISHGPNPSLNKMVCYPLPQAYERKFSDSMYGSAFGFLLEAKVDGDGSGMVAGTSRQSSRQVQTAVSVEGYGSQEELFRREWQDRPRVERRRSTQSEHARVLPPRKPAPSTPLPLPPTPTALSTTSLPLLPSRSPSPLKLDSDITEVTNEAENVFITLSPQHKSPSKACQDGTRPQVVAMAPLAAKSYSRPARDASIWV